MSVSPDDKMSELRDVFFESAEELVQKLNEEALRLEKLPGDPESTRSLRRTVHTLKGDAAACGFRELSELAHEFEDVLGLSSPAVAKVVPEIAMRAADVFAALLVAYRKKKKLPDIEPLRQHIARLAHAEPATAAREKTKPIAAKTKPNPAAARTAAGISTVAKTKTETNSKMAAKKSHAARHVTRWSEYEQLAIAHAIEEGQRVYHVVVELDPHCGMPIAARQMLQQALLSLGELVGLYPAEGSNEPLDKIEAALAATASAEQIKAKCTIPTISQNVKITALRLKFPGLPARPLHGQSPRASASADSRNKKDLRPPASAGTETNQALAGAEPAPALTPVSDNILRVDAERIDSVLNLVGELILAKSMLQQALFEFGQRFPKDGLRGRFSDAMAFQARVLNDLQRSVMKIRMVPVDQLFRRFPRTVRDVAHTCGKQVELVIRGGDTDLDKSILDAIAEPLTHLLRNAVGHGIETAAERTRAGKPAQGTVRLSAYHQGNQVVIELADDGGGIDVEKIRQRALAHGLVKPGEAARLTEAEALELIFRPGFSTAEEITELSGRGIGLDVVQSVLARLKGTVQVETVAGRGTTFRLRLPLTLAIIRALLFRVEQRLYALPLNAVAEITRATEADVHEVEHFEVLQLRNDVLPLLRLGAAPEPGPDSSRRKVFVLVINHGDRKFGLIVDELAGEEELVIKALDDQSITTDLVSGASILGDGRVVLILNLIALVERFTYGRTNDGSRMSGLLSNLNRMLQERPPRIQPGPMSSANANATAGGIGGQA